MVKSITNKSAKSILDKYHALGMGRAVSLSFGVYWNDKCEGAITFGAPISNTAVHRYKLRQDETLELRKMWMSDVPAAMSESRALSVCARIIKKSYPHIQMLITYCDSEDAASAYKGAGWIKQNSHHYLRELVLVDGRTISVREANRKGGAKLFVGARKIYVDRRKWVLPLNQRIASVVQAVSTPDNQSGNSGASPTQTLSESRE